MPNRPEGGFGGRSPPAPAAPGRGAARGGRAAPAPGGKGGGAGGGGGGLGGGGGGGGGPPPPPPGGGGGGGPPPPPPRAPRGRPAAGALPFCGAGGSKKGPPRGSFFCMFYGCSSTSPKLMPSSCFRTISEISA